MISAAGDSKGLPLQSIVGWFSPLPSLVYAGDSVVPDACHLALGVTPEWMERRALAIERAGNRCQVCYSGEDLNVHHRTYERRGNEDPEDLTVLCQQCHTWFHRRMREHEGLTHITIGMGEVMAKLETPQSYLVPTGFEDLDRAIGQLQKGQFILVGSRSEQGAIPFIITLGLNAVKAKKSLAFFSCTMNKERFAEMVMAIEARLQKSGLKAPVF
jgi:hypothetical protein